MFKEMGIAPKLDKKVANIPTSNLKSPEKTGVIAKIEKTPPGWEDDLNINIS